MSETGVAAPGGRSVDWRRLLPLSPVAVVVLFNLVVLRPELISVQTPNDFGMHLSMVRWAADRIGQGHLPFDGWYPYLSLGSPQFSQYPTLAHDVAALLARAFDAATVMRWTAYVLLATWPVAVYLGARLADLDRWEASCAAAVSPFLASITSYGLELSTYTWRGYGIWPQVWAQWLLPIAWGLAWRAVNRRGPTWPAALAVGFTFALHFVTGYVCVVGIGALTLAGPVGAGALRALLARAGRAALVVVGGMVTIAYVVVPLLQQSRWANYPGLDRRTVGESSSFGPGKAIGWLLSGEIYDNDRLPVLSVLVLVGLVVCAVRRQPRHRAVLLVWVVAFFVFAAGSELGPIRNLLPGSSDLFTRFIIGVHLAGLLAIGIGAAEIGRLALAWLSRAIAPPEDLGAAVYRNLAAGLIVVVAVFATLPAWRWAIRYEGDARGFIRFQQSQDATDGAQLDSLLDRVRAVGGGRVYAGSAITWGPTYRVGYVPVYVWLNNRDVDALGYWFRLGSLSTEVETNFIDVGPGHYDLFGVRYELTPVGRSPVGGATLVATAGKHSLWQVPGVGGYLGIVDTDGAVISADRRNLGDNTLQFLASVGQQTAGYPRVAFNGADAAPATDPLGVASGPAGSVTDEVDAPAEGRFSATVSAERVAAVVLRSSYSGKWSATVDGRRAPTYVVAPSFVGVTVPPGRHTVGFAYRTYRHYPELVLVGMAAMAGLAYYDRHSRRARERRD